MAEVQEEVRRTYKMRRSTIESLAPFGYMGEKPDDVVDRLVEHMKSCQRRPHRKKSVPQAPENEKQQEGS